VMVRAVQIMVNVDMVAEYKARTLLLRKWVPICNYAMTAGIVAAA